MVSGIVLTEIIREFFTLTVFGNVRARDSFPTEFEYTDYEVLAQYKFMTL